ncbi:hypothetical protein RHGRI_026068 [Rhododendron griersonianum]|uniref:UBC core domain-containing protein n=1 Tax=Rhododendron griersonianum TaxID=479676 RepID=A0AAV6IRH6_9ERIC|nr:hypothetical protein RHGRI_026068 [Rhododendron griersonianum]
MGTEDPEICARIRLELELRESVSNPPTNISFGPVSDEDMFHWQGIIIGPVDTPIEGGLFHLSIRFPIDYPFNPPKVQFQTQVFHPNIDVNGRVGIRILGDQWSAALSVEKLLLSISSILLDPIILDGHNPVSDLYWHERDYCSNKKTTRLEKQLLRCWSRIKLLPMIRNQSDRFKSGRR